MKERAYPVYTVNKHAEGLLVGGHPWVCENDILNSPENEPENGTLADVVSTKGSYLGTGFVSLKSKIRVRLISRNASQSIRIIYRDIGTVDSAMQPDEQQPKILPPLSEVIPFPA